MDMPAIDDTKYDFRYVLQKDRHYTRSSCEGKPKEKGSEADGFFNWENEAAWN
jgi:hypothetical protein